MYAVVDLSGGPNASSYPVRYTDVVPNLEDDTCRTTELWLRKIPKGTFIMGSPEDEEGRFRDETQHEVTLTQDYYIGVFECTQRQWELVMGDRPSFFNNTAYYATRPVEQVSYNMIRGTSARAGAGWPSYGHAVDATSFMGKLQTKTGLVFDLPTEAQWEYACRAGTTTALNSGKDLTSYLQDPAMDEVGRYEYNNGDKTDPNYGTEKVGSYLPNVWGLYAMHGNVSEWCLDWHALYTTSTAAETDPIGPTLSDWANAGRVLRGGNFLSEAQNCRSARRALSSTDYYSPFAGFRIVIHMR